MPTDAGWVRFHGTWARTEASARWIAYRDDARHPLPSGGNVSPEEDTNYDPRAAKGDAQLVPASETR